MALDDLDDRFAAAVRVALAASRTSGDEEDGVPSSAECPSADAIASYYEYALSRAERARLEDHFSGCARCQGTLAALLRAAPALDNTSEPGAFTAAARRAAAEPVSGRGRWFEISPAWRIAGVSAAATVIIAVAVVAGMRVYRSTYGRDSEQVAAMSPAPAAHRRHQAPAGSSPPSDAELALNDTAQDKKSQTRAEPATPKAAHAPAAAALNPPAAAGKLAGSTVGGVAGTTPQSAARQFSNTPPAGEAPEEETLPPAVPADNNRNGAGSESAAQAAAALGALAVTPAPPAAASVASAPLAAAAPPATLPAPAAAQPSAGKGAAAVAAGTIAAAGAAAIVAENASSTPASEAGAKVAAQGAPATAVNAPALKTGQQAPEQLTQDRLAQQELAKEQHAAELAQQENASRKAEAARQAEAVRQAKAAREAEAARQAEATRQAEAARQAETARKAEAAREAEAARQAELARKADLARRAEVARKAEQAKRDADLRHRMEEARREAQAKSAPASSAPATEASPQSTVMMRPEMPSAQPRPQPSAGKAVAGNEVAMAERPAVIAPATARIAPGVPVAPRAVLVSPPDHSVFWSLQSDGIIYGTHDRKSWSPQYTGVADFLAGTAPSNTVCWAVGRRGAILLTIDGTHWTQISSPTTSDVIGITAAGKDVATIFTANGATYSTFDGGSNWQKAN